jgi:hypothetical protein
MHVSHYYLRFAVHNTRFEMRNEVAVPRGNGHNTSRYIHLAVSIIYYSL